MGTDDDHCLVAPRTFRNHIPVGTPRGFIGVVLDLVACLTETLLNIQPRRFQAGIPNGIALAYFACKMLNMSSQANCQVFLISGVHLPPFCLR